MIFKTISVLRGAQFLFPSRRGWQPCKCVPEVMGIIHTSDDCDTAKPSRNYKAQDYIFKQAVSAVVLPLQSGCAPQLEQLALL